jgi:hypothetical protein
MQLVWYAGAVAAVWLALRPGRTSDQLIAAFLAVYYAWVGIVFFGVFYRAMNDHAVAVGALFVLGGLLWLIAGFFKQELRFGPRWDVFGVTGGAIMLYALVVYPIVGLLSGHVFPAAPIFGLAPCPTGMFTFGLLLWTRPRVPMYLLAVPLAWSLSQTPDQALALGIIGDLPRTVVAVVATIMLMWRDLLEARSRPIAVVILALAILFTGHDDVLSTLAIAFLIGAAVRWLLGYRERQLGGNPPQAVVGGSGAG